MRSRLPFACGMLALVVALNTIGAADGDAAATTAAAGSARAAPGARASTAAANQGTATEVAARYGPKGRPPIAGAGSSVRVGSSPNFVPSPDEGFFRYAHAGQAAVTGGAWGYYTVATPVVAPGDFHSLAELSVLSSDLQQIVEVGWTVDRKLNGDDDPHLFAYHWVDGAKTCYNACGFVSLNDPRYAVGMKLPVSSTPAWFAIRHFGTKWLVGYNRHWVGYFPDALWADKFKVTSEVQLFGEVDSGTPPIPCSQMGTGEFASSATAARIQNVGFWNSKVVPALQFTAPNPDEYTYRQIDSAGFRFGGPGSPDCKGVPEVRGDSPVTATNSIRAAGFVRGTISTVTDPLCETINTVISQTPAGGTSAAPGSTVSFAYGVPPASGCPIEPN